MGMRVSNEQSDSAAESCVATLTKRFGGSDVTSTVEHHSNAFKMAFVRVQCPPQHWPAVAKSLRFDHGANYTGMPSSDPYAEPCDPSSLGNPGGNGNVPIWNALLANEEFFDNYINRWQDLANGPLSCDFMIQVLDSMVAVIDPEMPRQIATWGGTYGGW